MIQPPSFLPGRKLVDKSYLKLKNKALFEKKGQNGVLNMELVLEKKGPFENQKLPKGSGAPRQKGLSRRDSVVRVGREISRDSLPGAGLYPQPPDTITSRHHRKHRQLPPFHKHKVGEGGFSEQRTQHAACSSTCNAQTAVIMMSSSSAGGGGAPHETCLEGESAPGIALATLEGDGSSVASLPESQGEVPRLQQ